MRNGSWRGGAGRWMRWLPALLLLPLLAGAHARLTGSDPGDGSVLASVPAQLALSFSEPVRPAALRLLRVSGELTAVDLDGVAEGRRVLVSLPPVLPDADYALEYRVLAADGHVVRGTVAFTLAAGLSISGDAQSPVAEVPVQAVEPPVIAPVAAGEQARLEAAAEVAVDYRWLAYCVRAAFVLLLLLSAGQALFLALLPLTAPLAAAVRGSLGWLALAGLAIAPLHLQASGLLALDGAGLLDPAAWRLAAGGSLAASLALAAPGFLLLALAARRAGPGLLLAGAALLLASRALTGHPAARDPAWLLMPAMVLHAGCAAWWYGALGPLARTLASEAPAVAARIVERFAVLAMGAVALLAFAGLMMALVYLAAPAALPGTDYGRLLLGKLLLFALLLCLAAWHRLALSPALARGDQRAGRLLRAGIAAEALVMTLLLLVSVALTGSAPELPDGGFWR